MVIPNGYDEEDFKGFNLNLRWPEKVPNGSSIRLLHAGVLYPEDRDPRPFFRVLSRLKQEGYVSGNNLRVDLRASSSEDYYSRIIRELGIDDLVYLLPALPYQQALQDCSKADGLLLFQGASCNHQIPAKVYEYLRLQKPIFSLTADNGDTAALLRESGGATIVELTNEKAIYDTLPRFLKLLRNGQHPLPDINKVQYYDRKNQAFELAKCLSSLVT
jgi:glycosyltransferase involved in cell wall biosynthesis